MRSQKSTGRFSAGAMAGFTLVELMVVVVIVAIIAAIAVPSYQEYVAKTRRGEAAAALMEAAQALERYYTTNGRYVTTAGGSTLPSVFPTQVPASGTAYYTIAAVSASNNAYLLQATRSGIMSGDDCGNFRLDQAGTKTLNGKASGKPDEHCWRR